MKALILSDVHSNLPALRAVLAAVRRKRIDVVFLLGDLVGYGAQPNQVVDRLRRFGAPLVAIRGNHDRAVGDTGEASGFNHAAREAVLWTRHRLTPENGRFIRALPEGPLVDRGITLFHGSPLDEDEYLFGAPDAVEPFRKIDTDVAFFGHTHLPMVFRLDGRGRIVAAPIVGDAVLDLQPGERYLINPGSVGQPRDRDPRAAFALADLRRRTVRFRRVVYDVAAAQQAILRARLPEILAYRLEGGF